MQIISVPAIRRFLKNVQSKDVTAHWVEGGFHELLLGPWQRESSSTILEWLQMHA